MSRTKSGTGAMCAGPWIAHTYAMRMSPAWRALTANDKGLLEALEAEHMRHGGARNGRLVQTYNQLTAFVSKRQAIPACIKRLECLGFIEANRAGYRKAGGILPPNTYRLTYVTGRDDAGVGGIIHAPPATDAWKAWATEEQVADALARLTAKRPRGSPSCALPLQDIDRSARAAPE